MPSRVRAAFRPTILHSQNRCADMVVSNKEDSQSDEHHIGGGYPNDRRGTNQSAVVEPSGASTATHFLSSIAGAATQLFPMGVASGISQVQYGDTYPSQGEDIRKASNGRNDREIGRAHV